MINHGHHLTPQHSPEKMPPSFRSGTNFEPYSYVVAFLKIFCFSDTRFDGNNVAAIFWKQGSLPPGFTYPNMYGNHPPSIGHESSYRFQIMALLRRNGNEEPWGRTPPEPNFAVEFDIHWYSMPSLTVDLRRLLCIFFCIRRFGKLAKVGYLFAAVEQVCTQG